MGVAGYKNGNFLKKKKKRGERLAYFIHTHTMLFFHQEHFDMLVLFFAAFYFINDVFLTNIKQFLGYVQ